MRNAIIAAVLGLGLVQVAHAEDQKTTFYGYINSYFELAEDHAELDGTGAGTVRATAEAPIEYNVPDIHFVMQSKMTERFKGFLNLKAPGAEGVEVSNAWVESQLYGDLLSFRLGKFYRPFELYNEILDAVPTYIGIEPPEMFDKDHLLVTRTTNVMFHGNTPLGSSGTLRYAVTTGNDERDGGNQLPIGTDIRYQHDVNWTVGTSYYTTGGDAKPVVASNGVPTGGVMPWMVRDQYQVYGVYAQYQDEHWMAQLSYFTANHNGVRDIGGAGTKIDDMCTGAPLNPRQYARFDCATAGHAGALHGKYDINTWYARLGYSLNADIGEFTPYLQYDHYSNPETVSKKSFGGDNEAGHDDDGEFAKYTAGLVYRPLPAIAVKTDFSIHDQDVMAKDGSYGEFRFSFSYYWRM